MRFIKSLGCGLLGYVVGALVTFFLVNLLSSNTHDLAMESVMTAVFFGGPVIGVFSFVLGYVKFKR
jgi:hypothetical protein